MSVRMNVCVFACVFVHMCKCVFTITSMSPHNINSTISVTHSTLQQSHISWTLFPSNAKPSKHKTPSHDQRTGHTLFRSPSTPSSSVPSGTNTTAPPTSPSHAPSHTLHTSPSFPPYPLHPTLLLPPKDQRCLLLQWSAATSSPHLLLADHRSDQITQ
eukprot:GHVQ01027182.1.p1 GENE.GHVQ01027182.1~~GHVQ01027182.1.p1  ORF type:complete len:158 (+),score=31.09 GHVQ01027182.1:815-1288(+)